MNLEQDKSLERQTTIFLVWYARRRNAPLLEANTLLSLGEAALMQAHYADAVRDYAAALALYRQIDDRLGEANALQGLGDAAQMQARYADARGYLAQAFDLYDAIGMPAGTLRFAIYSANAALDQAHRNPRRAEQAEALARWLLSRAEQANSQCDPAVAAAYIVRLQSLRLRIGTL